MMTQKNKPVFRVNSICGDADPDNPFQCRPPNNPATCHKHSDWTCHQISQKGNKQNEHDYLELSDTRTTQ